nr:Do family serine endopeptidase [Pseudoroseicyclus aestuarii]
MSFADLAEEVSPAVVNITTTTMVAGRSGPSGAFPEGSPFEEFFRDFNDREDQPRRSSALGSGFVVSADGYVVTNNHVIEGADEIEVEFYTGGSLPAEVIGTDPESDIALLKVDGTDLPFVQFGDSDGSGASVGDWVMAMGNPLGQGFSISAGIISARGRALQGAYDDYIQTDAAINRGNSGGPLFNMEGEVIGVNTAILSPNGGSIGIGFAMSSSVVSSVVDQLQEFGETRRGWLGVHIQAITPDMVGAIAGLDAARGALITAVPEGPAQEAGIEAGDVILSFDGQEVEDDRDLVRLVGGAPIGEAVEVTVLRNGDTRTLPVTLGRRETVEELMPASAQGEGEAENADILGLSLSEITPSTAEEFGLDEGTEGLVVTQIDPASDAAEKGLAPGDIITEAGQQPVTSLSDLQDRVSEARDAGRRSLLMLVRRGGEPRFVALVLGDDDN